MNVYTLSFSGLAALGVWLASFFIGLMWGLAVGRLE